MPLVMCPPFTSGEGSPASGQTCLSQKAASPPGQTLFAGISTRAASPCSPSTIGERSTGAVGEAKLLATVPGTIVLARGNHGSR